MKHISFIKTPFFMKKQSPFQNNNLLQSAFYIMRILFVPKMGPFLLLQKNELTDLAQFFTESCWQPAAYIVTI